MTRQQLKKTMAGAALALTLILSGGLLGGTTQAQDRDRDQRWQHRDNEQQDRDWNRQRRDSSDDRDWRRNQTRDRDNDRDRYYRNNDPQTYRSYNPYGTYGNYSGGYYGNYGNYGGGANYEVQRGFQDGLNRGVEDARDGRSFNPNNSSHFRSGNAAYRSGFSRGYNQGYRQFAGNRRW
jgi:hypothetical protein